MNKLTKDLIYEIAIQGQDKEQWDKTLKVFRSKETRTPWTKWINYKCWLNSWGIREIEGQFAVSAQGRPTGWEIVIDQEAHRDFIRAVIRARPRPSAPILFGFMFQGKRNGPRKIIQGKSWMHELILMCNCLASNGYTFLCNSKDGLDQHVIRKPEHLPQVLRELNSVTRQEIVRAILDSGLDFYPEPVLQLLKISEGLGINCKP